MSELRIGSLFSGAAGLDMAVEAVFRGTTVWHCEVDLAASKVLAYRYPNTPNLGDITAVDWTQVEPVDILCGGFPCTDVSAAGKRAGLHNTRSGLWSHYAQAIATLRPEMVIIENVRGLLSAHAHRPMESDDTAVGNLGVQPVLRAAGAVLGDLADLGYDAQWTTLAASSVGAPHRRERVFILASAADADRQRRFSQRFSGGMDSPQPCADGNRLSLPDTPRNGRHEGPPEPARLERGPDAAISGDGPVDLLPTPKVTDLKGTDSPSDHNRHSPNLSAVSHHFPALLPTPISSDGTGGGIRTGLSWEGTTQSTGDGGNSRLRDVVGLLLPTPEAKNSHAGPDYARMNREGSGGHDLVTALTLLCTLSASDGAGGKTSRSGGRIDEPLLGGQVREMSNAWGKYESAIRRWEALTRPAPAPTEPNKNGNPCLSAAFSEWLMGWPAGWVTNPAIGISRNDQLRIIGNGVCPQQAVAALHSLLAVEQLAG